MIDSRATQAEIEQITRNLGLDRPLWEQYFVFLGAVLQGDFGHSFIYDEPAIKLILQRLPATLELAFAAMVFSIMLGWLPTIGRGETVEVLGIGLSILTWDGLKHIILPALNLGIFAMALLIRLVRAGMLETLSLDYVKFARSKGVPTRRIILIHVLKNILIPIITVLGLEFGLILAFAVVTETVFAWPGMGKLIIDAINLLDRPVIVAYLAAYMGGRIDALVMRVVDVQLGFPAILIALILLAVLGRGVDKVIIALIASQWVYYARVARGAALVELRKEYIESVRCLSLSATRIVLRHLLPNCLPPLIVIGTVEIAHAIALEATISFLGVGMPITEPSLGLLIANGYGYLLSGRYWISFFPGIALLIAIASINVVGDQLRDVLNPRLQR